MSLNFSWQQTMIRIKDPKRTIPFYRDNFNCTLIRELHVPEMGFSVYFMATLPEGETVPEDSESFLWNFKGTTIEFCHNHGAETNDDFSVNNGNVEPHRGFGHIAFNTDDVYAACAELEARGASFQKKPDEGRMKGLAFVKDPDGYWVEIVRRVEGTGIKGFNLSQTMIRVKDIAPSLKFYRDVCGMSLISERHFPEGKFSLFFLACLSAGATHPDPTAPEASDFVKTLFNPVLELTHNHGTELDPAFAYHNGNTAPSGFGHLGFLVDDVDAACNLFEAAGFKIHKRPNDGKMKKIGFVLDPDNYWIELIPRGLKEADLLPK